MDEFNFSFEEIQKLEQRMNGNKFLISEDQYNRRNGNAIPDIVGAEFFFLLGFITDEMYYDFGLIEQDFLKHCHDKLESFHTVPWDNYFTIQTENPFNYHKTMVLGLILNGAKTGDSYCIALIRYLYRTYHKKEYNQVKRFQKISAMEIFSITGTVTDVDTSCSIGRILTYCDIAGVGKDEYCSVLYLILSKLTKKEMEGRETYYVSEEPYSEELYLECREQIIQWLEEDAKERHPLHIFKECKKFAEKCLKDFRYAEEYIGDCIECEIEPVSGFSETLAKLKSVFPNRNFDFSQVQYFAILQTAIKALVNVSDLFEETTKSTYSYPIERESFEKTFFQPEKIVVDSGKIKAKEQPSPTRTPISISAENIEKNDYLLEIDRLRNCLDKKEQECKQLKSLYSAATEKSKEMEHLLLQYQTDREELIALREFVYSLEHGETLDSLDNDAGDIILQMKKEIANKNYIIIGGHVNLISKLKAEFPNWKFILPSDYRTIDAKMLIGKDMIFFFSDCMSHASYKKFITVAREKSVPFSYLHGVNKKQVIRQVYEASK